MNADKIDTLAVVGVGLLGGSVALAAKRRGVVRHVVGTDESFETVRRASALGIVDQATPGIAGAVAQAGLVVICTPVDHVAEAVLLSAAHAQPGTIITDVGSTKAGILNAVKGKLPPGIAFVGGHPLAGSEKNGPDYADAGLFEDRLVVLTPAPAEALDRVSRFWQALGARVRVMDADEHDRAVALTSHLPHLAASALAGVIPPELHELTATGYRDATRLAAANGEVWSAIFGANRGPLLDAVDRLRERLDQFHQALQSDDADAVSRLLAEGRSARDAVDRASNSSVYSRPEEECGPPPRSPSGGG
jgi:prephenate dehydrogenase